MKTFFACFVGVLLGAAASSTKIRVLDPLQDSDCVLCKHLIDNWGEGNIYNWGESNDLIRKAACAVLLEDSDARIVDPKWKLHSAAMLANDKESTILKEAIKLRNMLGIDPTLICGFMGVQSSKGGCACPIELIQFKGLKDAIASVRDSTSGSLLSSKPSEVKIALKCDTTTNQISLLELGKRRANIRTRARTSISIQNSDACTGDRGKGYHNKEVKGLMNSVQSHSGLVKKVGDTGTGLALGGASVGLTILCPPIGIAFGVLAGALSFFGGEASEDLEREIMRKIMRQTHHAITKKVQPAGGGTPKCVWELAKESPKYDRYVQAVKDLGLEFNKMYHEGKTEDGAPLPQVLKSTPAVTMTNLLLNLVPGTATMLTQEAFKYTLDGVLSDVYSNRAICVMYLMHCFYIEALIRETGLNPMQPQRIRDREGAHKTREGETDFNRNWLDMDVFGDFLENEMLDLMNTHRGVPGGKGIELLCAGKRGKGSCKEHHELKKQYRAVKKAFVEKYLRSDMPGGKASSDGAGGGGGGGLDSGRAGGGRGLAAPRAGGGDSGSGGDAAEERRR